MSAYVILEIDIHDPTGFQKYRDEVPAMIAKHGGEYLVRGGEFEIIEGNWKPRRVAVIRFPTRQAIRNFFADPAYAPLKALRQKTSKMNAIGVDGVA